MYYHTYFIVFLIDLGFWEGKSAGIPELLSSKITSFDLHAAEHLLNDVWVQLRGLGVDAVGWGCAQDIRWRHIH
jgi:hypothetical protein